MPFENLDTLREAVETTCANVTYVQLRNVVKNFEDRLEFCLAADGGLFEHLL